VQDKEGNDDEDNADNAIFLYSFSINII